MKEIRQQKQTFLDFKTMVLVQWYYRNLIINSMCEQYLKLEPGRSSLENARWSRTHCRRTGWRLRWQQRHSQVCPQKTPPCGLTRSLSPTLSSPQTRAGSQGVMKGFAHLKTTYQPKIHKCVRNIQQVIKDEWFFTVQLTYFFVYNVKTSTQTTQNGFLTNSLSLQ